MSFRGRNKSRFRRSGSYDKPFRGRGRSNDHFHRRDVDRQIDVSSRGGRGRRYLGPNLRSPRSHNFRGRYQYHKKRGRNMDSFKHFEERECRRFSPRRSRSPGEWLGEGPSYLSDDSDQHRRSRSRAEWFEDCDDNDHLEDFTRHSNGRSISPLIIRRNFEQEDYENARERSLERREMSPKSDRSRSLGRNPFFSIEETMPNRRSRSPLSMRSYRSSLGRPRSQLSTYSMRRHDYINNKNRSLERSGSQNTVHSRRYRRDDSKYSHEIGRRPHSKLSFCSRSFEKRSLSRSPRRFFSGRSESRFSIRSRSFERSFKRERSFGRRSNSGFSVRSGSLKRSALKGSQRGSILRSRSPLSLHSRDLGRGSLKPASNATYEDDFVRDKSLLRRVSPGRKASEKSFKLKYHHFKKQYEIQALEHQRKYHEKRSESSIERFLSDCKQSVEKRTNSHSKSKYENIEQSESCDGLLRKFKGLDHIVIERGQSFERSLSPKAGKRFEISSQKSQYLRQKNQTTQDRLSPISSKSGSVGKKHNKYAQDNIFNLSPISNSSIVNQTESVGKRECIENAGILICSDIQTNEEHFNLSPISKSSMGLLEKIELADKNDFESRLSPISSQSGNMGEKVLAKSGDIFIDQLNLSPISQSSSFNKDISFEKSGNLSPISQTDCFEDEKSNDSMQEFLAELERDEIRQDERSCSPKPEIPGNEPFLVVPDKFIGGYKKVYTSKNKEPKSELTQKYHPNLPFFATSDIEVKKGADRKISNVNRNKFEDSFGKPHEQSNLKDHAQQPSFRPSQMLCSNEPYSSQNTIFKIEAMKDSNVNHPMRHSFGTSFHHTSQIQQCEPNHGFPSMGNVYNPPKQNILEMSKTNLFTHQPSSDQLLRNPYLSSQEKTNQNFNNYPKTGSFYMPFPNYSQNTNEIVKLHHMQENEQQMQFTQVSNRQIEKSNVHESQNVHGASYPSVPYQQSSDMVPPRLQHPLNFGVPAQMPSNYPLTSTGNTTTIFHQAVNKPLPNSEMPQIFQLNSFHLQSNSLKFQEPQWQQNSLEKNISTNSFPVPQPTWNNKPNQNESYFTGTAGQIRTHQKADKSDQNRSNLKLLVDSVNASETSVRNNLIPVQNTYQATSTFTPLQQSNTIQRPLSYEKSQSTLSCNDNQPNFNLAGQNNPQFTQISTSSLTPVDIRKHLAPIFGRNYFPVVFPQSKEVILISDDEEDNVASGAQLKNQAQMINKNMNVSANIVPSSVFVGKYKDSIPSLEDMKQMFETFVIYFGVRNNSQLEKDMFLVIRDSFSRSENFGSLDVEENEEYHDFLPVPKQACTLRWNGVLLSKATSYSKEEARHKASISLINLLAHVCYTVQAKYSYYCGGKLPKFMMKKPEQPGIYKVVDRDTIIQAVTSTLKILKEKNYNTGKGVDATHVRVLLGIIDDFFRDKSTFCELIFGSQGQTDQYTIGELKTISTHVSRLQWLEWRTIKGYGRGTYTAVSRKKTPQDLRNLLLSTGENQRYRLIPPQDPWIDMLLPNCQYNPNLKKCDQSH